MKLQVKTLSNLLLLAAVALLAACGGSSSSSKTNKTVSGKALKPDGTAFEEGSTVTGVDQNGNAASGTVDANGNYSLKLVSVSSSGKKGKDVTGNTVIKISNTNGDSIIGVVPSDDSKMNLNAITSAAAAVALGDVDIDAVLEAAKTALTAGKTEVEAASILTLLSNMKSITKELFKSTATQVVNSVFGVDSTGASSIDADKFINGDFKEKDKVTVLLKAAASATGGSLIDTAVSSTNGTSGTPLLNSATFIKALGDQLGASGGKASDLIGDLVKSNEVKDALRTIQDALQTYIDKVVDAIANSTTVSQSDFDAAVTTIPTSSTTAASVTVTVSRSGDTITYSVANGVAGDVSAATMYIYDSASALKATVSVGLVYSASGVTPSSATAIVVSTSTVSVTIKNVTDIVKSSTIDLAKALTEAKSALEGAGQTDLAAKVPASTTGYTIVLAGTPVVRGGKEIKTLVTSGTTTTSAITGVTLK